MKVGNTVIHKYNFDSDFEALAAELDHNITLDMNANHGDDPSMPSIQATIVIHNGLISKVNKIANDIILNTLIGDPNIKYAFNNWVFKATNQSPQGNWHEHIEMPFLNIKGDWTWVYYVTMPNKDRGNILFREGDDEINYDPKPGDLLIFPSPLYHWPQLNPNSNMPRRVIGGNLAVVKYKTKKTVL